MNTQTITISGVDYDVKFGIKSNIILGKEWKVNKLSQIGKKLASLQFKEGAEPTMQQLAIMADLVLSGIKSKQPDAKVDTDDVFEFIVNNAEQSAKLMELYAASLPNEKVQKSKNVKRDQK